MENNSRFSTSNNDWATGTILYNMADTYFIGQVNDVNQVAAISVTMPVFLVLMSLGALFGIGSASYISRMMGSKNEHEMKKLLHIHSISYLPAALFSQC